MLKIFYAGNFPQMKDIELEKSRRDLATSILGETYSRLISFWFEKDIRNVITMKREESNESKPQGLVRRIKYR